MKTILFQGDSITDCGRVRDEAVASSQKPAAFGPGYPFIAASHLSLEAPGEYRFISRGIHGSRIVDLFAKIKSDLLNLSPDYVSILLGINDVAQEVFYKNGVATPKFERIYRLILDEVYAALPNVKILLFTPFVLEGSVTVDPERPEKWEAFQRDCAEKAEAVKRIARDYPVGLSVTQPLFDAAARVLPPECLLIDGIHPGIAGNQILAREFLRWFESVK